MRPHRRAQPCRPSFCRWVQSGVPEPVWLRSSPKLLGDLVNLPAESVASSFGTEGRGFLSRQFLWLLLLSGHFIDGEGSSCGVSYLMGS